jgi:hypothetical protein
MVMWSASGNQAELNIAAMGLMSTAFPRSSQKRVGVFIQPLIETTMTADAAPASDTIVPRKKMPPRKHALPAVKINPEKYRLDEKREAFQRKRQTNNSPGKIHEAKPQ